MSNTIATLEAIHACRDRSDFRLCAAVVTGDTIKVFFVLLAVDGVVYFGERVFKLYTQFRDPNDLMRELWYTDDMIEVFVPSHTAQEGSGDIVG